LYLSTLVSSVPTLRGLKISAHPLQYECGQKSTCQAQHEVDEPWYVHTNGQGLMVGKSALGGRGVEMDVLPERAESCCEICVRRRMTVLLKLGCNYL